MIHIWAGMAAAAGSALRLSGWTRFRAEDWLFGSDPETLCLEFALQLRQRYNYEARELLVLIFLHVRST